MSLLHHNSRALTSPLHIDNLWKVADANSPPSAEPTRICFLLEGCRGLVGSMFLGGLKGSVSKTTLVQHPRVIPIRHTPRAAAGGGSNPIGEEGFWDKEEGKKKMGEIEQMRELIAEAQRMKDAEGVVDGGSHAAAASADEKAAKLREELARRAKEQAEQRKQAETMFQMGQRAYGRGVYDKSVVLFEAALTNVPSSSNLGGEIQLWLAMAYEAHNRHDDCIALYKRLEKTHPSKAIRRQAADLRYILDAPKLKISRDEMVTIPMIDTNYGSFRKTWSEKLRDRKRKPYKSSSPPTRDYLEDWLVWKPPRWQRNRYFWVAVTVWLTLAGVSLMFQD